MRLRFDDLKHVWPQVAACHCASGQHFDSSATLGRNLASAAPVADDRLTNAERPSERGYAAEMLDGLIECFHGCDYHASCLLLSTRGVFAMHGRTWVNTA